MRLVVDDPLAHRALDGLLRAEAAGRRRRLHTSKANATEVVDTLERRGLVERRRLEHDRRAAVVSITARGAELVDRLFPEHPPRGARAVAPLDDGEKRPPAR